MDSIQVAYINALLADAAYSALTVGMTPADIVGATRDRLTQTQADYLAANFEVASIADYSDIPILGSGFDAVVWRGKAGTAFEGQVFISMRGTQLEDGGADLLADTDVALNGGALSQIVDMVNWWLRETTPAGQSAQQILWNKDLMRAVSDTPVAGTGNLVGVTHLSVNGHSLGGHLATAFARIFGASVTIDSIDTFNSAGFNTVLAEGLFRSIQSLLGKGLATYSPKQNNYYALNGVDFTTNEWWFAQQGQRVGLYNEQSLIPTSNHAIYKLTDLLSLGNVLAALDSTFTISKLNTLVQAASSDMAASYEGVLDSLRKALLSPYIVATPTGDVDGSATSRATYQADLSTLQNSAIFKALTGKLIINPTSGDLRAAARNSYGAMVALQDLSPFYLSAVNASADALLSANWQATRGSDYAAWAADKSAATPTTYTDAWISDRSILLSGVIALNNADSDAVAYTTLVPADRGYEIHWVDKLSDQHSIYAENASRQGSSGTPSKTQAVFFGNDGISILTGTDNLLGDRLYGGGGNDELHGLSGNDYLEGNADNDLLDGGAGNDTLLGGTGDDTYTFSGAFGKDTVSDVDGNGRLVVDGAVLTGGKQLINSDWQSDDRQWNYALTTDGNLVITRAGGSERITVQGWQSSGGNHLGITLQQAPAAPTLPVAGTREYDGDQRPLILGVETRLDVTPSNVQYNHFDWASVSWQSNGTLAGGVAQPGFADVIIAGTGNDIIRGFGGNDALDGRGGDDYIDGGDGDDLIAGGAGSDYILGGAGNDVILSAHTLSVTQRVTPNDQVSLPGYQLLTVGPRWAVVLFPDGTFGVGGGGPTNVVDTAGDVVDAGPGADIVTGGLGDDQIDGGTGDDTIFGHGGADLIEGGEGNDRLWGDGLSQPDLYQTLAPSQNGDDFIDGGAGDDQIRGQGGNDALYGGDGNDQILGDDIESELPGSAHGNDWLDGEAGDDDLYGCGGDDTLLGGAGDDYLYGDLPPVYLSSQYNGNDWLDGGAGNDVLFGNGGDDTLLGGSGYDYLYGEDGNDWLDGGDGDDLLMGDAGNDTLIGGAGNDDLSDSSGDNLLLGGDGDDWLQAGDGHDTLDGGDGDDVYWGGSGSAVFVVGQGQDWIQNGSTSDTVRFSEGIEAGDIAARRTLVHTVTGWHLTDALMLQVAGGASVGLNGFFGGYDIWTWNTARPAGAVQLSDGSALDFAAHVGYTHTAQGSSREAVNGSSESDWFAGGAGADVLRGNLGNDTLDGGAGADTLFGGAGDDTFYVDNAGDSVRETAGQGVDWVFSSVSHTLAANVENLTLLGASAINGRGNALDNQLHGNDAANTLNGGRGADLMEGAGGDDVYVVDNVNDQVIEYTGGGADLVRSSVNYTLGANVENLTLQGAASIAGVGNELNNTLLGNTGRNVLDGRGGDDVLRGGSGADTLIGGSGNDTYLINRGGGADVVRENDDTPGNTDVACFGLQDGSIDSSQLWFRHVNNDLVVSVIGTQTSLTFAGWYSGAAQHVEQFRASDGKTLLDSQVDTLVQAMARLAPPRPGQANLPTAYQTVLAPVLAASWH